jgi:hypothetical protein
MNSIKTIRTKLFRKETAPTILIVLNSFVWYLLTSVVFNSIINSTVLETQRLELYAVFFTAITVTAIIGSNLFSGKRNSFLKIWLFLGVLSTFLLSLISADNLLINLLIVSFFGASIGIGLPSCLSYFAKSTAIENRGIIGGTIWSSVGFIVLAFAFLISIVEPLEAIIILAIWRLIGGVGFVFLDRTHKETEVQKSPSYLTLIRRKEILLYLFPWIMFSLINAVEAPMLERVFGEQQYAFFQLAEFAFIGIFAFIGGFIADIAGRKRVVIAGFIMLGIEYATMSIFSSYPAAIYIFTTLDGITWGLLFSVFFTVIWGDLGENYEKEKLYALGGIPFLLSSFLTILIQPYEKDFPIATAFTVASFFLFVAVIPLMYAPETLPEKSIKDRDLQSYIEKAKRIAEKEDIRNENKGSNKTENTKKDEDKESPENEEARKLAEKYY